jgi:CBS domain containing-hemolysin-like protein
MIEASARGGMLDDFDHRLLKGAIGFGDSDAGAVMVPRVDIVAVPATATAADVERVVVSTGHSRVPVYGLDLDDVVGFVHAKDLLNVSEHERGRPIPRKLIRPLMAVPESLRLHRVLVDMQRERQQLALVLDELGGTAGILTLEDVVEELVGEIRDEYDPAEPTIERMGPNAYDVPGDLRVEKVPEHLGFSLPDGPYETVAGFVMDRLGRIPAVGDGFRHGGWHLRVMQMDGRRIIRVRVERQPGAPDGA